MLELGYKVPFALVGHRSTISRQDASECGECRVALLAPKVAAAAKKLVHRRKGCLHGGTSRPSGCTVYILPFS